MMVTLGYNISTLLSSRPLLSFSERLPRLLTRAVNATSLFANFHRAQRRHYGKGAFKHGKYWVDEKFGCFCTNILTDGWHKGSLLTKSHCQISRSPLDSSSARAAHVPRSHAACARLEQHRTGNIDIGPAMHPCHAQHMQTHTNMWNIF